MLSDPTIMRINGPGQEFGIFKFKRSSALPGMHFECFCGWPIDCGDSTIETTWDGDLIAVTCSTACAMDAARECYANCCDDLGD
jgi:hypothetical protein